jgi:hypothetical protein
MGALATGQMEAWLLANFGFAGEEHETRVCCTDKSTCSGWSLRRTADRTLKHFSTNPKAWPLTDELPMPSLTPCTVAGHISDAKSSSRGKLAGNCQRPYTSGVITVGEACNVRTFSSRDADRPMKMESPGRS